MISPLDPFWLRFFQKCDTARGARTLDHTVKSRALCQLSYSGLRKGDVIPFHPFGYTFPKVFHLPWVSTALSRWANVSWHVSVSIRCPPAKKAMKDNRCREDCERKRMISPTSFGDGTPGTLLCVHTLNSNRTITQKYQFFLIIIFVNCLTIYILFFLWYYFKDCQWASLSFWSIRISWKAIERGESWGQNPAPEAPGAPRVENNPQTHTHTHTHKNNQ